jgi:hypothetical protein
MAGKTTNIAVKHVVLFQLDFGSVGFDGAACSMTIAVLSLVGRSMVEW